MISIIVAFDRNNAIGKNNDIPWHLSDDLKRFKQITMGHTVIMGRNTWESLPFKPLKGRRNIVVSRTMQPTEGCEVVRSIEQATTLITDNEEAFIIGGAEIYKQTVDIADRFIITHVHKNFDADTFFPPLDYDKLTVTDKSDIIHDEETDLDYQYVTYTRI